MYIKGRGKNKMNNRHKKQLLEKINRLSPTEHEEIFKMMKQKQIPFTQNKNGIFFNLSIVTNEMLHQIESFVDFCIKNKQALDEYDKKINECKISNNYDGILQKEFEQSNSQSSNKLDVFLSAESNTNSNDDWQKVITDIKSSEKLTAFVDMLESNIDKIHKKKTNTKFVNAKKKYARKVAVDKKFDMDYTNNLELEQYLIQI